ncbi:MAG: glycogen debranching enzyme [Lachnospiraceae bacterium]|nr:glycogen debranching enzyme [Lachnospiraceae bacterium]
MREISGYRVKHGDHTLNGATPLHGGVNFTLCSVGATSCELLLFHHRETEPYCVLPIPEDYRMGRTYSIYVYDLDIEDLEYSYRLDGPYDPEKGLLFSKDNIILDPYSKAVVGQREWGVSKNLQGNYHARVVENKFNWHYNAILSNPMEDSIIYELHVRGFTKHASSGVRNPGTFDAIIEKIPYLKELGVTAVELMPVFEFDETRNARDVDNHRLWEYWGYNTVAFFAPNTSYEASAEYNAEGHELKKMIRRLNANGIEVILDVVFNHTAEGDENGPVINFKGLDNNIYYTHDQDGRYANYSGCGNTVNCNDPLVQDFIINCLRYWVSEYHVSGFRFDLASILTRDSDGKPMENAPLIERIVRDPILSNTKLIAESWDAGGLYQVGTFPAHGRWAEWNGKYRDDVRGFLKGDLWLAQNVVQRLIGSPDLYNHNYNGYRSSVNFLTCHDGFTLNDLYSYNDKHNEANGWNNTDGGNDNRSWNCGVEGETEDESILSLRKQMMRNAITVLMMSRGTPMILAGDEFCNTQYGNNNSYCQDNETSWLNWDNLDKEEDFFRFYQAVIALRKEHACVRKELAPCSIGLPALRITDEDPGNEHITQSTGTLCALFFGKDPDRGEDDAVYLAINARWEERHIRLPGLPAEYCWRRVIYTADAEGRYHHKGGTPVPKQEMTLAPRSVAVFVLGKTE